MRLGVYGGTFNPIHNGHLHILSGAKAQLGLDRLLLVPTCVPPHKRSSELAGDEDRLAMCRLAVQDYPWVLVDDREIRRGGVSYTSDTLRELSCDYPGAELFFLAGSDMFLTIERWHESEVIARLCTVVGFLRSPDTPEMLRQCAGRLTKAGWRIRLLDVPPVEASSTEIRAGGTTGLPSAVGEYIRAHKLYSHEANT